LLCIITIKTYNMKVAVIIILSLFSQFFAFAQSKIETFPNQPEKILKITYGATVGGGRGGSVNLDITKDSIIYKSINRDANERFVEKKRHWANTPGKWNMLCNTLNIDLFRNVKSGSSMLYIDGADTFYSVKTNKAEYSLLNGDRDADHYKMIADFCDRVERLIPKL
jgi:hypothetical protein